MDSPRRLGLVGLHSSENPFCIYGNLARGGDSNERHKD